LAIFSFSIPFALVYWSEQFISSGLTSILFAVFPFLVTVFSRVYIPSDKIGPYKIAGMILGFSGIVIIFSENLSLNFYDNLLPMIFVLIAAIMQAWVAVIMKKFGYHLNPLSMNFLPILFGGLLMLIYAYFFEDKNYWRFNGIAIFSVCYLAFFGTVLTFTTYYWLLKRMNVVLLSLSAFITPIIALFVGWVILDESLSIQHFIGSSFVLIGILFANFPGLKIYFTKNFSY
jgi:drug/metabolite transporter (DMT)-like permease